MGEIVARIDEYANMSQLVKAMDAVQFTDVPFVDPPKFKGIEFAMKMGRNNVSGIVDITFTGDGAAYVTTRAHINDNEPAVMVNGTDYLVTIHMVRDASGSWSEHPDRSTYAITHRSYLDKKVGPTIRDAIVTAIAVAVREQHTPEVNRVAAYAQASMRLSSARRAYQKAEQAMRTAIQSTESAIAALRLNAPR